MNDCKISTINGKIDNIYITIIKNAKTDNQLENLKKKYILNNPFVSVNNKKFYLGYINKLTRKKFIINIFLGKLKKKKEKRRKILAKFVNIVKYNVLSKKNPCNETDLYTLDEYNENNKNVYVIDIKNTKWWFTVETICKLICANLSYFDTENYGILCKEPINPFINKPFNTGQLISIYEQLERFKKIPKIFMLYKIASFNIDYFLKIFNNEIINYSFKFNLCQLENDVILLFLNNLFNDNRMYHTNVNKLNLDNTIVKKDVINLIQNCMFTYKNINQSFSIRKFIKKYNFIIRRANRPNNIENINTLIVLDDETEINLSEILDSEEDEEYVLNENITEIEPDNFTLSDTELDTETYTEFDSLSDTECDIITANEPQEEIVNNSISLFYIQAYIKGYLERKRINELKCIMRMKIQSCLKGYLERKKIKNMKNIENIDNIDNIDNKMIISLDQMKL